MSLLNEADRAVDANELRLIKAQVTTSLGQLTGAKSRGTTLLAKVNADARYSADDKAEVLAVLTGLKTQITDFGASF